MRILVVDDSHAIRMIVRSVVRKAGYGDAVIEEADHGMRALEIIRASTPDLVLSDWDMPRMTGFELLRTLRRERIAVDFGIVTSQHTPGMRELAIAAGALFLLTKPFTPDSFQRALSTSLGPPTGTVQGPREPGSRGPAVH